MTIALSGPRSAALVLAGRGLAADELRTLLDMTGLITVPHLRKRAARPVTVASKLCCRCGQVKTADEFYRHVRAPDGLTASCKECERARRRRAVGHAAWVTGSKRCSRCGHSKPVNEFRRNRRSSDGLACQCRSFMNAYQRARAGNPPSLTGSKRCTVCGESKPVTEFFANRLTADGRSSRCKLCSAAYQREWRKGRSRRHVLADTVVIDFSRIKRCTKCGQHKPAGDFHRSQYTADGLARQCKSCKSTYARNWRAKAREEAALWIPSPLSRSPEPEEASEE